MNEMGARRQKKTYVSARPLDRAMQLVGLSGD